MTGATPKGVGPSQAEPVPVSSLRASVPSAAKPVKPLGRKSYGSIPHLPGSRLGPGDHHCHVGQEAICTSKARDRHDRVIVTEKLDGGNVAIAKVGGKIIALGRAGYPATSSPFEQHHHFNWWVNAGAGRWSAMLDEGEAVHGEWLAMAHGTIYDLGHEPFVAFDLTTGGKRVPHDEMVERCERFAVTNPAVIHDGLPITVSDALALMGDNGRHGSRETVEGLVYRVERKGAFDFLAKFVRPDKQDGKYITEITGAPAHWHWRAPVDFAQAIEARRAATGTGAVHESAVAESDAPETPLSTPLPSGSIER